MKMKEKGISTLVLVFIIASILAMIIFVLYPISLLGARRASQVRYSQTAFFAAEGAIYETIQHLKDNSDWPSSFPYSDPSHYQLGDALIKREITKDEVSKTIAIDITATVKKAKRRLVVNLSYISISEEKAPLDICLSIDKSYSMNDWPDDPPGSSQPLTLAKDIALKFIGSLDLEEYQDKVAIQEFSGQGSAQPNILSYLNQPGSYDLDEIENKIQGISFSSEDYLKSISKVIVGCWWNIFHESGPSHARDEAEQVMVIISDGHVDANYPGDGPCDRYSCWSEGSGYEPDNAGTRCTDGPIIDVWDEYKDYGVGIDATDYKMVTLYIPNTPQDGQTPCNIGDEAERLARRTMEEIASGGFPYFQEIRNYDDLDGLDVDTLYDLLAAKEGEDGERVITSVFGLYEEIPEPD